MADFLTRITAPSETPISLAEVKAQIRVDHADEDTYITSLINAATGFVDGLGALGRAMVTQGWSQAEYNPPEKICLRILPAQSLDAVKYYDDANALQTATLADFELVADSDVAYVRPIIGKSWPSTYDRPDGLIVEYTSGHGAAADVPATIKHAMLMLVAHWYQNRETVVFGTPNTIPYGFSDMLTIERGGWYG